MHSDDRALLAESGTESVEKENTVASGAAAALRGPARSELYARV
jgi:hypothetical protein